MYIEGFCKKLLLTCELKQVINCVKILLYITFFRNKNYLIKEIIFKCTIIIKLIMAKRFINNCCIRIQIFKNNYKRVLFHFF